MGEEKSPTFSSDAAEVRLVDVASLLRAQARALRAQADATDAQAQMLEAQARIAPRASGVAPLLSKQQLATLLSVSTATIDRLCREQAIPFLTVGDARRFELLRVRQALEARTVETSQPPRQPEAKPGGVRVLSKTWTVTASPPRFLISAMPGHLVHPDPGDDGARAAKTSGLALVKSGDGGRMTEGAEVGASLMSSSAVSTA